MKYHIFISKFYKILPFIIQLNNFGLFSLSSIFYNKERTKKIIKKLQHNTI